MSSIESFEAAVSALATGSEPAAVRASGGRPPLPRYEAGVWEQRAEEDRLGFVQWSRHGTLEKAKKAAIKYARDSQSATGGALSWCGGVRDRETGTVTWYDRHGDVEQVSRAAMAVQS